MPDPVERVTATGRRGDHARPIRPSSPTSMSQAMSRTLLEMLGRVLVDLTYPAQAWQIIVGAEYYGAAAHTVTRLRRLPSVSYPSLGHIAHAYTHATGPWPDPGSRQPGRS